MTKLSPTLIVNNGHQLNEVRLSLMCSYNYRLVQKYTRFKACSHGTVLSGKTIKFWTRCHLIHSQRLSTQKECTLLTGACHRGHSFEHSMNYPSQSFALQKIFSLLVLLPHSKEDQPTLGPRLSQVPSAESFLR